MGTTPFLSQLSCMSFGFAPKGWAQCNGQLLPINQNQALFSLLGTTYGGDGRVNFGLPDLRGRSPMSQGDGHTLGERGGEQAHTLSISEIPTHVHVVNANAASTANGPAANFLGGGTGNTAVFHAANTLVAMNSATIPNVGGSQPHNNMQPYLVLNWCIALQGIFPSQT